jgi:hypothetical protein
MELPVVEERTLLLYLPEFILPPHSFDLLKL